MIYFFPSGTIELPSSQLRIYKVSQLLMQKRVSNTIIPPNLPDKDKHALLQNIHPGDIIYIQKVYNRFNRVENFQRYKQRVKLVYDIDDHIPNKWNNNLAQLCHVVIAGSHFTANYNKQFNKNIHVLNSITDRNVFKPINEKFPKLTMIFSEWHANSYVDDLKLIKTPLDRLRKIYDFDLILQGWRLPTQCKASYRDKDKEAQALFPYAKLDYYRPYEQYIREGLPMIQKSHIGLIPFRNLDYYRCKAGQNLRGFMSCGLPTVASNVGEHKYILQNGINGYLPNNEEQWFQHLKILIENKNNIRERFRTASIQDSKKYDEGCYVEKLLRILNGLR